MKYIIHACNQRMWYVEEFLIPSMQAQGIRDIKIHLDRDGRGCLPSMMESLRECGRQRVSAWHLQDDVAVSRDFARKTEEHDAGIVCGFWHRYKGQEDLKEVTDGEDMRYSFPCIRIPWEMAGGFAEWFDREASGREEYRGWIGQKKYDDSFFRDYIREKHPGDMVFNLKPSIVEHVDWLIGGSVANRERQEICRATYWKDEDIIEELKDKLAHRK